MPVRIGDCSVSDDPVEAHRHDAVVLRGRDVGEHRLTRRGQAEQAAFAARRDAGHAADGD